jgi:hypothetical protein
MRTRPFGIIAVCVFVLLNALTVLLILIGRPPEAFAWMLSSGALDDGARLFLLVWGALDVVAAVGLWSLSRRAWVLTMLLVGVGLLATLQQWWVGTPNHFRMALSVAAAFYLNSAAVRALFLPRREAPTVARAGSEDQT